MSHSIKNVLSPKPKGSLLWLINDSCNYNCSYCMTLARFYNSKERVKNWRLFIKEFKKKIPPGWNFYIGGGGEPTVHPDFYEIVESLADSGYNISIVTNLSISFKDIDKFFDKVKNKCLFFSASLHLEETTFEEFYAKIIYIRDKYLPKGNLDVSSVAIPEKLNLLEKYNKIFLKESINFRAQLCLSTEGKVCSYSDSQMEIIKKIRRNNTFRSFKKGNFCICGYRYAIINLAGEVFRCTMALREKDSMGNILRENINFYEKTKKCGYNKCFCGDDFWAELFFNLNN